MRSLRLRLMDELLLGGTPTTVAAAASRCKLRLRSVQSILATEAWRGAVSDRLVDIAFLAASDGAFAAVKQDGEAREPLGILSEGPPPRSGIRTSNAPA